MLGNIARDQIICGHHNSRCIFLFCVVAGFLFLNPAHSIGILSLTHANVRRTETGILNCLKVKHWIVDFQA